MTALRSVLVMVTLVASVLAPGVVHACSSDQPTFAEAVDGASAIARVIVADVPAYGEDRDSRAETYRVVRMLKGSLPASVVLAEPFTNLCHDTIGGLVAPEGSEAIVAFDVAYFGQVIHPAWVAVDAPYNPSVGGSAFAPDEAKSLDDLEALIEARLPDTALASPSAIQPSELLGAALIAAAIGLAARRRLRAVKRDR